MTSWICRLLEVSCLSKSIIFALLILFALPRASARALLADAALAADENSTRFSFDPTDNLIVIAATLNGKGPFRFLLDTGASHHVIKPELARALGLKVTGSAEVDAGMPGRIPAGMVQVEEVRIGDFILDHQQFFVATFPASYPFEGFLGAELFKRFVVRIDFQQSLITFYRSNAFRYQGPGSAVPLKFHKGLIPLVRAKVDDASGWFKLDTGYNGSLALFAKFVAQQKLLAKYSPQKISPGGQTLTGPVGDSPVAQIRRFRFGDLVFDNLETFFFLEKEGSNSAFSGAIGTALLNRLNIVIDYGGQRIILEKR